MGLGGISMWQLLIVLVIVVLIFGTKRLKSMGSDLGGAVKGFKQSLSDEEKNAKELEEQASDSVQKSETNAEQSKSE